MRRDGSSELSSSGLVLLDDDQQRALNQAAAGHRYGAAARQPVRQATPWQSEPAGQGLIGRGNRPMSPRTNFTTNVEHPEAESTSSGDTSQRPPSEYMLLRGSNPFITIEERASEDAVEAFAGKRGVVKISVTYILIGAAIGIGLGVLLSSLKISTLAAEWIALPGTLFLRALKSLAVPYVFCSVAVAIGDIVFVGKVSIVGSQTFKVFLAQSVMASTAGLAIALVFRPLFKQGTYTQSASNALGLVCSNGYSMEMQSNGSVMCSGNATTLSTDTTFKITDVNDVFEKSEESVNTDLNLSEQLISILTAVVPENVFSAMYNVDLLSVITFAMVMGAIAGRNFFTKTRRINYLYMVLLQMRNTFFLAIEWLIWVTPVAIISIIAGAFATNQEALNKVSDVYLYVVAAFCGMTVQMLVVVPAVHFLFTRCNPYLHMQQMVRAYVFAFCSASSLATAPITLGCIQKARVSSQSLSNFVVSIGVVGHLIGGGWYYPIGVVFLAESSGNGDDLTVLRIIALYCLTLVACFGTPPVPSGGQAMMSTIYTTVLGVSDLPATWALYVAMDVVVDRLLTVCNVNDDTMALKVIAENTDETVVGDHLGRRD